MHRSTVVGLVLLAAILTGALAAGTPVAGNDSVAAVTAGINLGTTPIANRTGSVAKAPLTRPATVPRNLLMLLQLLLTAGVLVTLDRSFPDPQRCSLRRVVERRGPPLTA